MNTPTVSRHALNIKLWVLATPCGIPVCLMTVGLPAKKSMKVAAVVAVVCIFNSNTLTCPQGSVFIRNIIISQKPYHRNVCFKICFDLDCMKNSLGGCQIENKSLDGYTDGGRKAFCK